MLATRTRAGVLIVALAANLALASTLNAGEAYACSCVVTPVQDEIQRSDAVFSGEVQSIADEEPFTYGERAPGRVTFDVRESWKGISVGSVDVYGQGDGANCYNVFEEGETYLVYASRTGESGDTPLENNLCGATKPLAEAETDLRLLGSPTGELPQTGGPTLPVFLGVFAALAVLLVSGAFLLRRLWT